MTHRKPFFQPSPLLLALPILLSGANGLPAHGQESPAPTPTANGTSECPLHAEHAAAAAQADPSAHLHEVETRGDEAMGFSHQTSRHHFALRSNGGSIEVNATDPADTVTRDQIREHLQHITQAFAAGDFTIPEAVHAQVPPGADGLRAAGTALKTAFENTPNGGRVLLSTDDPVVLGAIHDFLRFQITDHQTGDPLTIEP